MKESNYWQQFLNTGKVEDYLRFREIQCCQNRTEEQMVTGDSSYAGVCKINRNGVEDGAYRGI